MEAPIFLARVGGVIDEVAESSEKTSFLGFDCGADDDAKDAPSLGGGVDFELDGADIDHRSANESDIGTIYKLKGNLMSIGKRFK